MEMDNMSLKHVFMVPSLSCPAGCKYCFGPHEGYETMSIDVVESTVKWLDRLAYDKVDITFHGGEPLMAGYDFYKYALPMLKSGLSKSSVSFAMQSNLWLLTEELCDLFKEYDVSIGTSLDGPEHINDAQRGSGYFKRTMAGINLARKKGINTGCICTFTNQSAPLYREIQDFFINEELTFTIHAALPSIRYGSSGLWALSSEDHSRLLSMALDEYMSNMQRARIGTLDSMIKASRQGKGAYAPLETALGITCA
jgi:uncharacterized protein